MINKIIHFFSDSRFKALIAIGTAVSPIVFLVLTYNYYLGYTSYFGIPSYFISIGQAEVVQAVTLTIFFLTITTLAYLPFFYITEAILDLIVVRPVRFLGKLLEKTFIKRWLKDLSKKFKRLLNYGILFMVVYYLLFLFTLALSLPQGVGQNVARGQKEFTQVTDNNVNYLALLKYNDLLVVTRIDAATGSINRMYSVINISEKGVVYSEIEIDNLSFK